MGPCMCGDPACWSCGPAQGYCPKCSRAGKDDCDCDCDDQDEFDLPCNPPEGELP